MLESITNRTDNLVDDRPFSSEDTKYQPVQPVTVDSNEFPALARLAARVSNLAALSRDDLQLMLEREDGFAMPRELLDIALSINIGESE